MNQSVRRNWKHETDVADGSPLLASDCPEFRAVVYESCRMECNGPTRYGWTASVWWQGEAAKTVSHTFHPTVWDALRWAEEVCETYSERIVHAKVARNEFQARNRGVEVRYDG